MKRLYDDRRWRVVAQRHLAGSPFCVICQSHDIDTPATVVDHKIPHNNNYSLFWDPDNFQSLCSNCHSSIKQLEDIHGYSPSCGKDGIPIDPKHPWNVK